MRRDWYVALFTAIVLLSGLFIFNTCFLQDDPLLKRLEKDRDDARVLADSLRKEVVRSDAVRDSVLGVLDARTDSVVTVIRTVTVERDASASVRDSSMSALIEAVSIDAPHLTEGALSVARSIARTDSLYELKIGALNLLVSTANKRADQWESDFWTERDARLSVEGELAAERAITQRLERNLRRSVWQKRAGGVLLAAAVVVAVVK